VSDERDANSYHDHGCIGLLLGLSWWLWCTLVCKWLRVRLIISVFGVCVLVHLVDFV